MTITNPGTAGGAVQHDAGEGARRILAAVSLGAVAPESYPGQLHCQDRLTVQHPAVGSDIYVVIGHEPFDRGGVLFEPRAGPGVVQSV